jgi:hypothetical protein
VGDLRAALVDGGDEQATPPPIRYLGAVTLRLRARDSQSASFTDRADASCSLPQAEQE